MENEIIKVFNEGKENELALDKIRGGWCVPNITCIAGDSKCNIDVCSSDTIRKPE